MSYAKSFIIDSVKKYHFFIGFMFEWNSKIYQIKRMEEFFWNETVGTPNTRITAVATVSTSEVIFDRTVQPATGYAYWLETMGIDGFCGFQVTDKGYRHNAPRREPTYLYKTEAGRYNQKYIPQVIMEKEYPTVTFYNPTAGDNTPHIYFSGEKWKVEHLEGAKLERARDSAITIPTLENYMIGSMHG